MNAIFKAGAKKLLSLCLCLGMCMSPTYALCEGLPQRQQSEEEPSVEVFTQNALTERDISSDKLVALTFDDGPGPYTMELLDILDKYSVRATFFVVGNRISRYSDVLRAAYDRGHEIGNHTWEHINMADNSRSYCLQSLQNCAGQIYSVTGEYPTLCRPPYGSARMDVGYPLILWHVDPLDWLYRDTAYVTQAVLERACDGDIILLHDIHHTSVAAVDGIVSELIRRGYTFVTVSELLTRSGQSIAANTAYSRALPKAK